MLQILDTFFIKLYKLTTSPIIGFTLFIAACVALFFADIQSNAYVRAIASGMLYLVLWGLLDKVNTESRAQNQVNVKNMYLQLFANDRKALANAATKCNQAAEQAREVTTEVKKMSDEIITMIIHKDMIENLSDDITDDEFASVMEDLNQKRLAEEGPDAIKPDGE